MNTHALCSFHAKTHTIKECPACTAYKRGSQFTADAMRQLDTKLMSTEFKLKVARGVLGRVAKDTTCKCSTVARCLGFHSVDCRYQISQYLSHILHRIK